MRRKKYVFVNALLILALLITGSGLAAKNAGSDQATILNLPLVAANGVQDPPPSIPTTTKYLDETSTQHLLLDR